MKKTLISIAIAICCFSQAGAQNRMDTINKPTCYENAVTKCRFSPECVAQCMENGNPLGSPTVACAAMWLIGCAFNWIKPTEIKIEELPIWAIEFTSDINDNTYAVNKR